MTVYRQTEFIEKRVPQMTPAEQARSLYEVRSIKERNVRTEREEKRQKRMVRYTLWRKAGILRKIKKLAKRGCSQVDADDLMWRFKDEKTFSDMLTEAGFSVIISRHTRTVVKW